MISLAKPYSQIQALLLFVVLFFLSACHHRHQEAVDKLNDLAYDYHYRNLDTVSYYAAEAMAQSGTYDGGKAEALNHQAFVSIIKMQYPTAYRQLDSLVLITDNQVELLIADVQYMRLCQRESKNKDFYTYKESAIEKIKRIHEGFSELSEHLQKRFLYGLSEFFIVTSTYYYYVGLEEQSAAALREIDTQTDIQSDTAQYLNYLYNIGAGGIINEGDQEDIDQMEFDYLMRCYMLSVKGDYPFWTANALQAISEHLISDPAQLIESNLPSMKYLNQDMMPDSLLAGYLAQRSLELFSNYGDVYQVAGAYRTLAQCFWGINDYKSSLLCLQEALSRDTLIQQAPDLVASIREQLSVVYSAMNDKQNSDINRNYYLDKQEQTRQDRYLESRADQLNKAVSQTNMMIVIVMIVILATILSIAAFILMRRKKGRGHILEELARPLEKWEKDNEQAFSALDEQYEEVTEQQSIAAMLLQKNKKENLEQRAKISLVNSITPFIDRMLHEIDKLVTDADAEEERERRLEYVGELTAKINEYNDVLTQWIQLRQGEIKLHIESFPLQKLFDIIEKGRMGFAMKDIQLVVTATDDVVKADRILTLFMINTMADNARKFTQPGGEVRVFSTSTDEYVEVSVQDEGVGMEQEVAESLFDVNRSGAAERMEAHPNHQKGQERGHGFGLLNCKGIIEKYKKISSIFSVCSIGVESQPGKGSRFYFRLPKGIARLLIIGGMMMAGTPLLAQPNAYLYDEDVMVSDRYADSAYASNVSGDYVKTLRFADTIRTHLNAYYLRLRPNGTDTLRSLGPTSVVQPEEMWLHEAIPLDYDIILSMRNESAVAALALHEWTIYRYNNNVYTQLFKEISADHTLEDYCRVMQASKASKDMAVIILVLLLILIVVAYYILYYRHLVYYRFCLEKVKGINDILLTDTEDEEKLNRISQVLRAGSSDSLPQNLQDIVSQVQSALRKSAAMKKNRMTDIHIAEDELHRAVYEHEQLYICNSVLDNCLSTLKHETMYYPSRIQMLIADKHRNMDMVQEMAHYYKELYTLLSTQAMRQLDSIKPVCKPIDLNTIQRDVIHENKQDCVLLCDADMLAYLFEILRKQNDGQKVVIEEVNTSADKRYVDILLRLERCALSESECQTLFFPSSQRLPFLLCRQIVRDIGETTNARGCGIKAEKRTTGTGTDIHLILALAHTHMAVK